MKGLYHYNAITAMRSGKAPGYAGYRKIYDWAYAAAVLQDRTGYMRTPIRGRLNDESIIPRPAASTLNYKDCCDRRAKEIWDLSGELGLPIGLMWSGGIDSTRMAVSFLENFPRAELADRVKILTSEMARLENPRFYQEHLLPNFELRSSEMMPWLFDRKMIIVTGEHNDQIFGTDAFRHIFLHYNEYFNSPLTREGIRIHLDTMISDTRLNDYFYDVGVESAAKYGIVLEKHSDWWWWWNFNMKWRYVYFRIFALAAPKCWPMIDSGFIGRYLHHFYATDDFQLWSINNPQIRYLKKWNEYKHQAKLEIYQFDKNEDYYLNKSKKGSLNTVFQQRDVVQAIDEDFNFYKEFDPDAWYDPDNTFKDFD